jgi:hypothetical protein
MIQKYRFERNKERIPIETAAEKEVRLYSWKWMVYAVTALPKNRDTGKYNPLKPIEEQPGFCYLWLFKKEIRDKMVWPAYLMLREICNWEVELRDEGAHVVLVSKDGTLYHVEPRGHDTWEHINQMVTFLGNVIVGADQRT